LALPGCRAKSLEGGEGTDWDAGGVEGSIQGVISSPLGAFCFERSVIRSFFKLNFEKLAFGELDGSEIMDSGVIGVAVDETRYGLEILDVLIFFVDLCLSSSSDTAMAEGDFNAAVAATAWRCTS